MNKDAIISFIKKNMLSLACGLVALVSIALIFYPIGGLISDLQGEADTHAQAYPTLKGFDKTRRLPMSDPKATDSGILQGLPNAAVIKVGNEAVKNFKGASETMLAKVVALNQRGHIPLVPDELPVEDKAHTPFDFAKAYKLVLSTDGTVHGVGDPTATPPVVPDPNLVNWKASNLQNDILHGGLPPTQDEIRKAQDALWNDVYQPQIITMNNREVNREELGAKFAVESKAMPQRMNSQAAKKHKMYVERDAFPLNPAILSDTSSQISDIFYAQMQLWVYQDVAAAIAEANSSATNILDATVKRLIIIQVPADRMYVLQPAAAGVGGVVAAPTVTDDKSPIPPIYSGALSVTGRYCNGMYDVVRFNMLVDVDSARINEFIQTLQHQRLITVTSENAFALDPDVQASKNYFYGSGSAVRLQLECEELFMRSWTTGLMPDNVKIYLGLMQPKAGATPGMPSGAPSMGAPGGGPMPMMPGGFPAGNGPGFRAPS